MKPGAKGLSYVKQYGTGPVFSLWNNPYNLYFCWVQSKFWMGWSGAGAPGIFALDLILTLYSSITQDRC